MQTVHGGVFAQRQLLCCLSQEHPCKPPPNRSVHNPFNTASGVQNSGPWDPWLRGVENSRLFAQRAHSAWCAPHVMCVWEHRPPWGVRSGGGEAGGAGRGSLAPGPPQQDPPQHLLRLLGRIWNPPPSPDTSVSDFHSPPGASVPASPRGSTPPSRFLPGWWLLNTRRRCPAEASQQRQSVTSRWAFLTTNVRGAS